LSLDPDLKRLFLPVPKNRDRQKGELAEKTLTLTGCVL